MANTNYLRPMGRKFSDCSNAVSLVTIERPQFALFFPVVSAAEQNRQLPKKSPKSLLHPTPPSSRGCDRLPHPRATSSSSIWYAHRLHEPAHRSALPLGGVAAAARTGHRRCSCQMRLNRDVKDPLRPARMLPPLTVAIPMPQQMNDSSYQLT